MRELKVSTSWVRGVVGEALTPELIVNFACAFGTWAEGGVVIIARDTRRSSPMLRAAVVAGLLSSGCEVIDLDICTTPLASFAVRELGCAGGISITGSHNDASWNALKFLGADGMLLNAGKGEELLDIYHASAFRVDRPMTAKCREAPDGLVDRYLEHLFASLDIDAIRKRRFRLAIDFCNGAAVDVTSSFLQRLNCSLFPLNETQPGIFAHSPAPTPENMQLLTLRTQEARANLGAAVNVDGDRIAFVLPDGRPLSEEYTLPLVALSRLARRAGAVAANLSTSRMIDVVADRFGQTVLRTPVGESHVMDRALQEGAVLAGEGCGGTASLPHGATFDALDSLGRVLEVLATVDGGLPAVVSTLPRFEIRKGRLACLPDQTHQVLDQFRSRFADQSPDGTDGIRVQWNDAWMHIRPSTTEPIIRVIAEAETAARVDMLFGEALEIIRGAIDPRGEA